MYKWFYCSYPDLQVQCALTIAPFFPAMFQALFARSGALWLGLTIAFRTTHLPASQVKEKAVLAYMVLLEAVVGLLLPPRSQLQCCIINMPVLQMKDEETSPCSILVQLVAHVRVPLAAFIGRIGVFLEGDTCYFQFLLISFLSVLIQGQ